MQTQENGNKKPLKKKEKGEKWKLSIEGQIIIILGFAQYEQRVY